MIRWLQPFYNGGVDALTSHLNDKPKIRFCQRCEVLFGVQGRIMEVGVPKPSDYDLWLECLG